MLTRKIKVGDLADISFCLFLVMSFLSERTILGRSSMLLFIGMSIILILMRGRFRFSIYFLLEFIFIGYCILQNLIGITSDQSASKEMIQTLFVCTSLYIFVYNYALIRNNYQHVLKLFFLSYIWAIIINFMLDPGAFLRSRISRGITIGDVTIGGVIAISVGWMAGICMVLAVNIYKKEQKIQFWFTFGIMTIAIITSGTRKAFLFIPIALLGWFYFTNHRKNIFKLLLIIFFIILLAVTGYYIMLNNNVLYSLVGYRLENIVVYLFSGMDAISNDASMVTRLSLIDKAEAAFRQRPLMGWGLDNFRYVFNNGGYYAHNNFYEILVSGGWIGFVIYYLKYLYIVVSLWSCRKYAYERERNWISVFLLLAIIMTVLEYWQVTYYTRKTMMVWVMMLVYVQSFRNFRKTSNVPI